MLLRHLVLLSPLLHAGVFAVLERRQKHPRLDLIQSFQHFQRLRKVLISLHLGIQSNVNRVQTMHQPDLNCFANADDFLKVLLSV